MTGELERRETIDGWAPILQTVAELSQRIAGTDFVPPRFKGNVAAVAAAILTGREIGIGPMTALQNIYAVPDPNGGASIGISAHLMRALVLGAGHEIRYAESTSARCIIEGRRAGSDYWQRIEWTMEDARKRNLDKRPNWQKMPREMLQARATSALCRLAFADVIYGIAYSREELDDSIAEDSTPADGSSPALPARRAVRRATPAKAPPGMKTQAETRSALRSDPVRSPEASTSEMPMLPGEEEEDSSRQALERDDQERETGEAITDAQLKKLHTVFTFIGVDDRERRLNISRGIVGRSLSSSTELTKREASILIETVEELMRTGEGQQALLLLSEGHTLDEPRNFMGSASGEGNGEEDE